MPRGTRSPAFQFYPSDYLADQNVALMSLEAQGAYVRLLCYCWQQGKIPNDEAKLATLAGATNGRYDWPAMWEQIRPCFQSDGRGSLTHPRLLREKRKQDAWRAKSKAGGIASGKSRRENDLTKGGSTTVEPDGSPLVEPNGNTPSLLDSGLRTSVNPPLSPRKRGEASGRRDSYDADIKRAWRGYCEAREIYYKAKNGRRPPSEPKMTTKVRKRIRDAIKEHGAEKAYAAGRGIFLSPFHTGDNDQKREFLRPHLPWRMSAEGDNVETFSELYFERKAR